MHSLRKIGPSTSETSTTRPDDRPRSGGVQSDRDLTLVNWRLSPDQLEVVVAGPNLPRRLWVRLGSQETHLPKCGSPDSVRLGFGGVQEARYANRFTALLTEETFLLNGKASDAKTAYELRRGDRKGRLLLALPETIVCQQPDEMASPRQRATGQLSRDLTFISARLYPSHLEVVVAGRKLPKRLWVRLGDHEAHLPRRDSSELVRPGAGAVKEGRYANTLAPCLVKQVFSLSDDSADASASYELRRGDHKGRLVLALPDVVVCQQGDQIVSSIRPIRAGLLTGWAFDLAGPERSFMLELLAPSTSVPALTEAEVQPLAKSIVRGHVPDRDDPRDSPENEFTLTLPPSVFDGASHELCLAAGNGEHRQILWTDTLQASPEWIEAQIRSCGDRAELRRLLLTLAEAGRFEELARYFSRPATSLDIVLSAEDAFQVLAYSKMVGGRGDAHDFLCRSLRDLSELHFTGESSQRLFLKAAISFLNSAGHDARPHRFPHAPLAEAVLDFVFLLEDTANPGLLRELVSFCTQSRRYVLARQLAERWMQRDPTGAAPRVIAASIELATGNVAMAEELIEQALELKPKFREALLLLARIHAIRGNPLHAAAACGGGRGLSRWLRSPPRFEDQRLLAALDWPGVNAMIARHTQRRLLLEQVGHADDLFGDPERPSDGGFTLIFLEPKQRDTSALAEALRGVGCVQIVNQHGAGISELESIGTWTLIFCDAAEDYLTPEFIEGVFAQKRPFEPVVKLVSAKLDDKGKPERFPLCGALIRTELLRMFGACSLDAFVERATGTVRIKTVLV